VEGFVRMRALSHKTTVVQFNELVAAALEGAGDRRGGATWSVDAKAAQLIRGLCSGSHSVGFPTQRDIDYLLGDAADLGDDASLWFLYDLRAWVVPSSSWPLDGEPPESGLISRAFRAGRTELTKALIALGLPRPELSVALAAARGHSDLCDWLLEDGADPTEALCGAVSGGQARLVRHLGHRWSESAEGSLTFGFYKGAANPAHSETLEALGDLGWFRTPRTRQTLLEYAFGADNFVLVDALLAGSLDGLAAPGETPEDVIRAIWEGIRTCTARAGLRSLQVSNLRCPRLADEYRREAQGLLSALLGIEDVLGAEDGREELGLAPPSEATAVFRLLLDWGAQVNAECVHLAALYCGRELFTEVFEMASEDDRQLRPDIFGIHAVQGAPADRVAAVQALAFPEGIPHATVRQIANIAAPSGYRMSMLAPLLAEPRGFAISVGFAITAGLDSSGACPLRLSDALPFFLRGARLAAFQPVACDTSDLAEDPCPQADLLEALLVRPDADTSVVRPPPRRGLCVRCAKAMAALRPRTNKRKRKRKG